jgi:hypothetical protein
LAGALAGHPTLRVMVTLHLDPKQKLPPEIADQRARALAAFMIEHGVAASQLELYDCGVARPATAGPRQRVVTDRSEWFLIKPLPEQGMPSSLRCELVSVPSSPASLGSSVAPARVPQLAAISGEPQHLLVSAARPGSVQSWSSAHGLAVAPLAADGCGATRTRPSPTAPRKSEPIAWAILDPTQRSGVRSKLGCVPGE